MGKEVEEERLQSWGGRAAWGKLGEGRTDGEKNRPVTHVQREREMIWEEEEQSMKAISSEPHSVVRGEACCKRRKRRKQKGRGGKLFPLCLSFERFFKATHPPAPLSSLES